MASWEEKVRRVVPYVPGEQPDAPDMIKLNTNENPFPPSPKVAEALAAFSAEDLRLYPDPAAAELVTAIAKDCGVKPEQVFPGIGSDDVLALCFLTYFNSGKPVLFPDISYSFYEVWADLYRIPYETVPLTEDLKIRAEDYFRENGGIIFPNPNAPTGVELPPDEIRRILQANPDSVVIVDEAYVDFGAESAMPLLAEFDNLLVVQTFSKSRSMAGARIGYAVGNEKMIGYLQDVKYSFNSYTMNRQVIKAGAAAVSDEEYFRETLRKIISIREWAKTEFRRLGFSFADSKANFIFVSHKTIPARELFSALRRQNIFVRYFDKPRIDNYLRITIGTREQMERLFAFLEEYIGNRR